MKLGYGHYKRHHLKDTIFRVLAANPEGLDIQELIDKVYRGTGPDNPRNTIQFTIHHIRKMALPYTVETIYRCGRRYRLVFR